MTRGALLAAIAVAASGCDHARVETESAQSLRYTVEAPPRIDVRVDNGVVEVDQGTDGLIEIVVRKRARGHDRESAETLLETIAVSSEQEGNTVRVTVDTGRSGRIHFGGARADVEIRAPASVELVDVQSRDGRISLDGVTGTLRAETHDGRIRVSNVGGEVRLRTYDGSITGTNVRGRFDVATDDGRIQLEGELDSVRAVTSDGTIRIACEPRCPVASDWTIRTLDGSIDLSLPESTSARIDASTAEGRVVNRLSRFEGKERERSISGTVGEGGPLILVTTLDGRITLR